MKVNYRFNMNHLKLGISSKHYTQAVLQLLSLLGYKYSWEDKRSYHIQAKGDISLDIFLLNSHDIPMCIENEILDAGIVQSAVYREESIELIEKIDLGFGIGDMVIAVPEHSNIKHVCDLRNRTIATRNPRITSNFFEKNNILVNLFTTSKGTEVFPLMTSKIDAMVEYRKTGATLISNNLREIATILTSSLKLYSKHDKSSLLIFEKQLSKYFESSEVPKDWIYV